MSRAAKTSRNELSLPENGSLNSPARARRWARTWALRSRNLHRSSSFADEKWGILLVGSVRKSLPSCSCRIQLVLLLQKSYKTVMKRRRTTAFLSRSRQSPPPTVARLYLARTSSGGPIGPVCEPFGAEFGAENASYAFSILL